MKILFLSHCPHKVHLEFAKSVSARIKIIHLNWLVKLIKKIQFLGHFYPLISFIYSFFISFNENVLLIDGGSSLYTAAFLKLWHPKAKIVYLDGDMIFYYLHKQNNLTSRIKSSFFFSKIDAVISVSNQNKEYVQKFLKVPIEIVNPYPQNIKKLNIKRKNY